MDEQNAIEPAIASGIIGAEIVSDDEALIESSGRSFTSQDYTHLTISLVLEEYIALRSEIQKRIEIRQQIITLTLLVAGTILTVGVQSGVPKSLPLLYPILALFLAVGWTQQDLRIGQISDYIGAELEKYMGKVTLGWENYRKRFTTQRTNQRFTRFKRRTRVTPSDRLVPSGGFSVLLSRGVFITSQLLAIAIGGIRYVITLLAPGFKYDVSNIRDVGLTIIDPALLCIDLIVVVITAFVLQHFRRKSNTPPQVQSSLVQQVPKSGSETAAAITAQSRSASNPAQP